jgi:YHS domain-containing protein
MRKNFIVILFIAVFVFAASAAVVTATEDARKPVTNTMCPVSGGPVSKDFRAEYKGQYVYVCCKGCLEEFKADPEKFVAKMSKEERELIKTNELCPVSKEPVKQEFWSEDNGRKVYFCCAGCKTSFDKKAAANK